MTLTADRPIERSSQKVQSIEFPANELRAPFALRCVAFLIDYMIVIAVPVLGLILDRLTDGDTAKISHSTSWLIASLLAVSNIVIFPALSGQTMGMMLSGLRIVRTDGADATVSRIIVRNTVGYLITLVTGGLGFLIAAFTPKGRALHDYIANTIVVFGKKRVLK